MEIPSPPPPIPRNHGPAIVSLVCGIVAFVLCLGPLAGIPAIICGHLALNRIAKSNGALRGTLAGTTQSYVNVAGLQFTYRPN